MTVMFHNQPILTSRRVPEARDWEQSEREKTRPLARVTRRVVAAIKRTYPIFFVFAIFIGIAAAIIALRLAIWLPAIRD